MSILTRTTISALALAAMMAAAQAQTAPQSQDHGTHHPGGGATAPAQPAPTPAQPGRTAQPGMPGMMSGGGMMGQQNSQPGMMGNMGGMMCSPGSMQGDGMHGGGMGCGMMGGGMGLPFEHVEGRLAFLKTELKITDAQQPQWNAMADATRANAAAHRTRHEQMGKGGMPAAWMDRLTAQQGMLTMRLDALKRLEAAAKPLYAVLTDEQRKLADTLLSGPMGMM